MTASVGSASENEMRGSLSGNSRSDAVQIKRVPTRIAADLRAADSLAHEEQRALLSI